MVVDKSINKKQREENPEFWAYFDVVIASLKEALLTTGKANIPGVGTIHITKKKMKRYYHFAPEGEKYKVEDKICPGFFFDRKFLKELKFNSKI